jgi:hypothetical protein
MFGATTLSGSVVCGSQLSACSFHHWFGNFGGTGFPVLLALKNTQSRRCTGGTRLKPESHPQQATCLYNDFLPLRNLHGSDETPK